MLSDLRKPTAKATDDEATNIGAVVSLLMSSGVPKRYRTADVRTCSPEVIAYADGLIAGRRRNLVIQGEAGTGKTYAACGALRRFVASTLQSAAFVTFDDLLCGIRDAYGHHEAEKAFVFSYTSKKLLVVDDFGKEQLTQWSLPIVWRIVNKRYNAHRPTIFTTQYSVEGLAGKICSSGGDIQTAKAIVRRMVDPLVDGEDSGAVVVKAVGTYA